MARSGTDDRLLCVAFAVLDLDPRGSKELVRITDQSGDPPVRQTIPNEPTLTAAADQSAVEKAAQMVRDVGLTQTRMPDDFLHTAFARQQRIEDCQTAGIAEATEEFRPQLQGVGCRKIVLNVLCRHIIIR